MISGYDKIIIGAGLYGLYAASFCAVKGQKVLVLEYDGRLTSTRQECIWDIIIHEALLPQ